MMIYRHLDAKEEHPLYAEGAYNMQLHGKNNLL